jgi:hypothetical protein
MRARYSQEVNRKKSSAAHFSKPLASMNKAPCKNDRYKPPCSFESKENVLARYFFHQVYGDTRVEDREGECFSDLDTAILDAITSARHVMGNILMQGKPPIFGAIHICDQSGNTLEVVRFRDALASFN